MRALTDMRLLIIDDNLANVEVLEQLLEQAGYTHLNSTTLPETAVSLCEVWEPDLILLDLHMPRVSGYELLSAIRHLIREPVNVPVLVVTADVTSDARHRALSMGARDFISKPIDQTELLLRVRNLLQNRQLQQQLKDRNAALESAVAERTQDLEHARLECLRVLAALGEYHDDDTQQHTERVGSSAALIAQAMQQPREFVDAIQQAAPLHDIGKIGIPRSILLKRDRLTGDERETMMRHVPIGAQILALARSPVLCLAEEIARCHHENWDGTGYPSGLSGTAIPISGRITAVADVFDALTHERPYKPAWDVGRALTEIKQQAGRKFDPDVVKAFLTVASEIACADSPQSEQLAA